MLISGVHYVRSEWRQVEIQPGTQTEDRPAEAHPRTAGAGRKGRQVSRDHAPRTATVGIGMTAPRPPALTLSAPIPGAVKKKRVLLVDASQIKRAMRSGVMRKLGMDVDCAVDVAE